MEFDEDDNDGEEARMMIRDGARNARVPPLPAPPPPPSNIAETNARKTNGDDAGGWAFLPIMFFFAVSDAAGRKLCSMMY